MMTLKANLEFTLKRLLYVFPLFISLSMAGQSWNVTINNVGHLDGTIEGFMTQVQATVNNPTSASVEAYFRVTIRRTDAAGLDVTTEAFDGDFPFTVMPGDNHYTIQGVMDHFDGVNLEDIDFGDYDYPGYREYIQEHRRLPPGTYETCLFVRRASDEMPLGQSCMNFTITPRNPPQIQIPHHGRPVVSDENVSIYVNWIHPGVFGETYTLEIKKFQDYDEAGSFDVTNQAAFDDLPDAIEPEREIDGFTYTVTESNTTAEGISPGDFIAIRVTAEAPPGIYENQGRSNIVIVAYGVSESQACRFPNFTTEVVWPIPGDTLPFRDLHYVIKFEPLCDNLREGQFSFETSDNNGFTLSNTVTNRWRINGGGPYNFLTHVAEQIGWTEEELLPDSSYAQYLPLVHGIPSGTEIQRLHPNTNGYRMSANVQYTFYDETSGDEKTQSQHLTKIFGKSFFIGMPKPNLISPANDAVVAPGNLTFSFNTGKEPSDLLPPFQIMKITGNQAYNPYLNVKEKLVLQVSKDREFSPDSIVFDGLRRIQVSTGHPQDFDWEEPDFSPLPTNDPIEKTTNREYHEDQIRDLIFRQGDMTFDITEEDTLYWRVVWLKNPEDYHSRSNISISDAAIYHSSEIRRLIISNDATASTPTPTPTEEGACSEPCEMPSITNNTSISSLPVGGTFKAGKFDVTVTEISGGSGGFSGKGTVEIPLFNHVKLKVEFSGIRINTDGVMYDGEVTGVKDAADFNIAEAAGGSIPYIDTSTLNNFNTWMNEGERLVNFLSGKEIGLPIGLDREIDGRQVVLGMTAITLEPRKAMASFVTALEIPEIHTHISAGARVCIQPNGFSQDSLMLYLPFDQVAHFQDASFILKGGDPTTSSISEMCFITFNCNGFKAARLAIEGELPRSAFIPDEGGSPSTDSTDHSVFSSMAYYELGGGFIMQLTMDRPFYFNGAEKVKFTLKNGWIDLSSTENPTDITFPANYSRDTDPTWEGFYLEEIGVGFANELIESDEPATTTVSVRNLIYDGRFTCQFGVYNIIPDGKIRNWKATLDTIELQVTESEVDRFNVTGKLEPPIAGEGEYLNYRMVFDFDDTSEYYLQVDVQDSLRVPLFVAQMSLHDNSYVRAGINSGTGAYIRANFSGRIDVGNENISGHRNIPQLAMPGIAFENLLLDSETGISCENWDFTGLSGMPGGGSSSSESGKSSAEMYAGPSDGDGQGFAAGFPLSIDSMKLGGGLSDPQLSVKLRLAFQQGENGIAAGAGLTFKGKWNSDTKKISLKDVELNSISIEAEFSAVALKGELEWQKTDTKEDVRGALEVQIPTGIAIKIAAIFGTYKASPNARHGTADNYNYWLVDGAVSFGDSGIPICSGIALYGIGGGVWHHMQQDSTKLPSPKSTLAAADTSRGDTEIDNTKLNRYTNNFDIFLGLRFSAVLGIQNASSTINMQVGILAEFNQAHGLSRLTISGAVYVMQKMSEGSGDQEGMLYGQAELTYTNNADGKSFNGDIEVWLNVAGVVVGGIDDHHKLADVTFYAGEEEWYFRMGSYNSDGITPGAAIKVQLGGMDLIEASAYMLVGYGVPTELPPPPAEVRDLLKTKTQSKNKNKITTENPRSTTTSDYDSGRRKTDPKEFRQGKGFAFGTNLKTNFGFDAFVYFKLAITLGFDILLVDLPYECNGYEGNTGINGWYAQGQAYAAVEGELGLKFKFFGKRKIQLLYLGVGMMLRADLPNPSYFKGRAGVRFSVLGGVFEGHKTITIELGEKCEPIAGDPLAEIKFIDEITPKGRRESVFSIPTVTFNFPMNEELLLPRSYDPDTHLPTTMYRFKPKVTKFKTYPSSQTEAQAIVGDLEYTIDNKTLQRIPLDAFEGYKEYTTVCEVQVRDYTEGDGKNGEFYRDEDGKIWVDKKSVTFKTGPYPEVIPPENVTYTYPINRQRFFLQNETRRRGVVALDIGMSRLFYRNKDGKEYEYVLRVTKADDFEDTRDIPIFYPGRRMIPLSLPQLENEEIYLVHLVRKTKRRPEPAGNDNILANAGISTGVGVNQPQIVVVRKPLLEILNGEAYLKVSRVSPESLIKPHETKLYEFSFRTSKYNSLSAKLSGARVEARTPSISPYQAYYKADVEVNLEEGFDTYDLNGYYHKGHRVVAPLVTLRDPMISDYWTRHGLQSLYRDISGINSLNKIECPPYGNYRIDTPWPNGHYTRPINGNPPADHYEVAPRNWTQPPLSDSEISAAVDVNNQNAANPFIQNAISAGFGNIFGNNVSGLSNSFFGNNVIDFSNSGDDFFTRGRDKLLLTYKLGADAFAKWHQTRNKISRFWYLKNNVPIRPSFFIYPRRVNLPQSLGRYLYLTDRTHYANASSILNTNPNRFKYVTTPYTRSTEFGSNRVSNNYQLWMLFNRPPLPGFGRLQGSGGLKTYKMTSDPGRLPPTGGLY